MKIRKILIVLFTSLFTCSCSFFSQEGTVGIDERINEAFMPFALAWESLIFTEIPFGEAGVPVVLILLMGGATFFTFYFRFINFRHFITAIQRKV